MILFEAVDFFNHLHGYYNPEITKAVRRLRIMEQHIRVENNNFVFH